MIERLAKRTDQSLLCHADEEKADAEAEQKHCFHIDLPIVISETFSQHA